MEGRPATANRSYGDASTVTRSAAQAAQIPVGPPADAASPAPVGPTAPPPGGPFAAARPFAEAAARPFARMGAALSGASGQQGQDRQRQAAARPATAPGQARVRKARLRVARLDPWSVMKVSFVLSIAMGVVTVVGTAVVWNVLNALGVFTSLNKTVGDLTSSGTGSTTSTFSVSSFLSFGHVEGYIMIIALVDVVLVTALATLGAYLYNLAAGFVGGFEVTLAEDQ